MAAVTEKEDHAVDLLVGSLRPLLEDLAVLDQAEVLAAGVKVGRRLGRDVTAESESLQLRLLQMPPAVSAQFSRLGVLA